LPYIFYNPNTTFFTLFSAANLSYEIPAGVANDLFHVDWQRGIITTRGQFDRESQASYVLPVYVRDANRLATSSSSAVRKQRSSDSNGEASIGQHFDVATVYITIGDVNDNSPEFRPGSCYGLSVPENSELGVIHTVVASDLDEGPNADLIYSITGKIKENPIYIISYWLPFYLIKFFRCVWRQRMGRCTSKKNNI